MEESRKRKERSELSEERWQQKAKLQAREGNMLLAGYLAHEFLTEGTLLGRRWGLAGGKLPAEKNAEEEKPPRGYGEVACLMKMDGAHIAGIVNPTQLARWLQKNRHQCIWSGDYILMMRCNIRQTYSHSR